MVVRPAMSHLMTSFLLLASVAAVAGAVSVACGIEVSRFEEVYDSRGQMVARSARRLRLAVATQHVRADDTVIHPPSRAPGPTQTHSRGGKAG